MLLRDDMHQAQQHLHRNRWVFTFSVLVSLLGVGCVYPAHTHEPISFQDLPYKSQSHFLANYPDVDITNISKQCFEGRHVAFVIEYRNPDGELYSNYYRLEGDPFPEPSP